MDAPKAEGRSQPFSDATNRSPPKQQACSKGATKPASRPQIKRIPPPSDKPVKTVKSRKFYVGEIPNKQKKGQGQRTVRRVPVPGRSWPATALSRLMKSKNTSEDSSGSASNSSSGSDSEDEGLYKRPHDFSPVIPSPLSPYSLLDNLDEYGRQTPIRLLYPHRGHSRSSLVQQKAFWQERHDDWLIWQAENQTELAYEESATRRADFEGSSSLPDSAYGPPPRGFPMTTSGRSSPDSSSVFNLAILPRVGDLAALRDPMSVVADQDLIDISLCTLAKMSWLFDSCFRAYSAASHKQEEPRSDENNQPRPSICTTSSTACEDVANLPAFAQDTSSGKSCASEDDVTLENKGLKDSPSLPSLYSTKSFEEAYFPAPRSPYAHDGPHIWEVCWQVRSEILRNEVNRARERTKEWPNNGGYLHFLPPEDYGCDLPDCFVPVEELSVERATYSHIVPIDEEEEDYGEILDNPTLRVGATLNPYTMFDREELPEGVRGNNNELDLNLSLKEDDVNLTIASPCSSESTLVALSDETSNIVAQVPSDIRSRNPYLDMKTGERWSDFDDVSLSEDVPSLVADASGCNSMASSMEKLSLEDANQPDIAIVSAGSDCRPKLLLKAEATVQMSTACALGFALMDVKEEDVWSAS